MEDVLSVYKRAFNPDVPLVCMDETSKQLIAETRNPIPAAPGQPERYDYEYKRNGVCNLFMFFEPSEARRLLDRLQIHYTPKHGSWLNMAEIELSVLSRRCLDRRIPDKKTLATEVTAWQNKRNTIESKIDWRFTNDEARIKLKRLYPILSC